MTIFYCLRLETPPTWGARSLYLYPPGTGWPSYTPSTGLFGSDTVQCYGYRKIVYEHLKIKVFFIPYLLSVLILVQMWSEKISGSLFFQEKGDEPI
jgi:hypothetical protein